VITSRARQPATSQAATHFALLPAVQLTAKEKEVLRWSGVGKSSWEIGRIIGCSESGVNFHFCNIRRKFGVNSRHIALLIALAQGVISLSALSASLEAALALQHQD
jgi:LuxR family quorum-sensing transcriptional regulator LasR